MRSSGFGSHGLVVLFRHLDDDVHHIRHAARAFVPLVQGLVDHGGNNDLPGIFGKKLLDDPLEVAVGDDVALANKHDDVRAVGEAA